MLGTRAGYRTMVISSSVLASVSCCDRRPSAGGSASPGTDFATRSHSVPYYKAVNTTVSRSSETPNLPIGSLVLHVRPHQTQTRQGRLAWVPGR